MSVQAKNSEKETGQNSGISLGNPVKMIPRKTILHSCVKQIEFSDTDMAGIVHFSCFFKYMEYAEARLFENLNIPILKRENATQWGWPRIQASCKYLKPLSFPGLITIKTTLTLKNYTRLYFDFKFLSDHSENDEICAQGQMTTTYAILDQNHGVIKSIPIPDQYLKRLTQVDQPI